jgi:hypothetical protein
VIDWLARKVGGVIDFRLPDDPLEIPSATLSARVAEYYEQLRVANGWEAHHAGSTREGAVRGGGAGESRLRDPGRPGRAARVAPAPAPAGDLFGDPDSWRADIHG